MFPGKVSLAEIAASLIVLVYILFATTLVVTGVHHYPLLLLAAQVALLLPAILIAYTKGAPSSVRSAAPSGRFRNHALTIWICSLAFLVLALATSYHVSKGITYADESAYRFQARIFAQLRSKADAPAGSPERPLDTPEPLAFSHLILFKGGWFSKYPIGWPAVLAIPERLNLGWAVTPVLGFLLVLFTAGIVRELFGRSLAGTAVWMAILSPFWLSQSVGRMSHALCGVLVASAYWFCIRGVRSRRTDQFAWMLALLVLNFHVRPYTAFLASAVLGFASLWYTRDDRKLLVRIALISVIAGIAAVSSVLAYNFVYTGIARLSPYALYDGQTLPTDIAKSSSLAAGNLISTRGASIEITLVWAFPFIFLLAGYGAWIKRRVPEARVLMCIFPVFFLGNLLQSPDTGQIIGERMYFEAYFSVVALASCGLEALVSKWKASVKAFRVTASLTVAAQAAMIALAVQQIARAGEPYRRVEAAAEHFQQCNCAVFLLSDPDAYYSRFMNLNRPTWKTDGVFYLNDPGPYQRAGWAALFGWNRWVLMGYNEEKNVADTEIVDRTGTLETVDR